MLAAAALLVFQADDVRAQSGLFSTIFGGGSSYNRSPARNAPYGNYRYSRPDGSSFWRNGWYSGYPAPMYSYGRYRTLCVRSCDGYYWPVSFSTTRAGFARDAKQCESSCAVPAKLFVHSNPTHPGVDTARMVDLKGMPYSRMENAFLYRKEYLKDCRCKPEPWSEAAKQEYARRVAGVENPEPVKTAADQQDEASGAMSPAVESRRSRAINRRKLRRRTRSSDAKFSGQWWAGSW